MKPIRIPPQALQYTGKTMEEVLESRKRIEDFRKAMEEQLKVNVELLLLEMTI
jgi:hypothetical protein